MPDFMTGLMKPIAVKLEEIYIPAKFRATLDPKKVEALAESLVEKGLQTPINVRRDKERYVLVAGLHRLEAARSLGEKTIQAFVVRAPQR
jgi:sulfiredoxin